MTPFMRRTVRRAPARRGGDRKPVGAGAQGDPVHPFPLLNVRVPDAGRPADVNGGCRPISRRNVALATPSGLRRSAELGASHERHFGAAVGPREGEKRRPLLLTGGYSNQQVNARLLSSGQVTNARRRGLSVLCSARRTRHLSPIIVIVS